MLRARRSVSVGNFAGAFQRGAPIFLHFEVCYYAPIEWAIGHGINSFDPGAGGSHKRRRGFVARPHASLHRWYQPQMDSLIRAWLPKVNGLMLEEIEAINAELPFKADAPALGL